MKKSKIRKSLLVGMMMVFILSNNLAYATNSIAEPTPTPVPIPTIKKEVDCTKSTYQLDLTDYLRGIEGSKLEITSVKDAGLLKDTQVGSNGIKIEGFKITFPISQEGKNCSATIKIKYGVSSATIELTGIKSEIAPEPTPTPVPIPIIEKEVDCTKSTYQLDLTNYLRGIEGSKLEITSVKDAGLLKDTQVGSNGIKIEGLKITFPIDQEGRDCFASIQFKYGVSGSTIKLAGIIPAITPEPTPTPTPTPGTPDGFGYYVNQDNTIRINSYIGSATAVQIPQTIEGKKVMVIAHGAFANNDNITSVTIPEGVTTVEWWAFYNCENLRTITMPSTLTDIGEKAFFRNTSLKNIVLPRELTYLGSSAFEECTSLESITIPESITTIANKVFKDCIKLTQVNLPETLKRIKSSAFENCNTLTNITIPSDVRIIKENAFAGCSALTTISIPNSVTLLEDNVFLNSNKVAIYCNLDSDAYQYAKEKSIKIQNENYEYIINQDSTITITKFKDSDIQILIPAQIGGIGVKNITSDFSKNLTNIQVEEDSRYYASIEGVLYNKEKTILLKYPSGKAIPEFTIPEGVNKIGNDAFLENEGIQSIHITKGVTAIGQNAFKNCSNLEKIELPDTLQTIGDNAFMNNQALRDIQISSSVTTIGKNIFSDSAKVIIHCQFNSAIYEYAKTNKLPVVVTAPDYIYTINEDNTLEILEFVNADTNLTIPAKIGNLKVKNIPETFSSTLVKIEVERENEYYASENGVLYNKDKTTLIKYPDQKPEMQYSIPKGVQTIAKNAFDNCNYLTNIDVPKTVTNLGEETFGTKKELNANYQLPLNTKTEELGEVLKGDYSILKQDDTLLEDKDTIGTGMKIKFSNNLVYNVMVSGDVSGDGEIGVVDLTKIKRDLVGIQKLEGVYQKAGDTTQKGKVSVVDLVKIKKVLVGLDNM